MSAAALRRASGPLPGERKHPQKRGPQADVKLSLQKGQTVNKLTQAELGVLLGKKKEWPVEIDLSPAQFQLDSAAWLADCPDIIKEYVSYQFVSYSTPISAAVNGAQTQLSHFLTCPEETHSAQTSLSRLNFSSNALSEFTTASHLSRCKRFLLSDNRITDISFKGMKSVVQLALDHNRIEHLTDMSDLQKLEFLDLSSNRVTSTSIFI